MNKDKFAQQIKKITKTDNFTYEDYNNHKLEIFSYIDGFLDGQLHEPLKELDKIMKDKCKTIYDEAIKRI
jgi:hypothetical protein